MNIEILIERLDHWRKLIDQYPESEMTLINTQRFKTEGSTGPDFIEVWEVNGSLASHIQEHDPDWIV